MKDKVKLGVRLILGLIYFVFGLNFFFNFIPMPPPPEAGIEMMNAFMKIGFILPMVKVIEIIVGLCLLGNLFVPLAAIVIAPITINIFCVHAFILPEGLPMAVLIVALNLALGYFHWDSYKHLFKMR